MTTLGEQIKQLRVKKGLTQNELASSVGATKASISNYERNQRIPQYSVLHAMAEVLEVPVTDLLAYTMKDENDFDNTSIDGQIDTKRPRRIKKLIAAFDQLSDEAQLIAIERVEELGLIPMYQKTLQSVLQQYLYNKYQQTYEFIKESETQETYANDALFNKQEWILTIRQISFQKEITPKEKQHWDFLYYSCPETLDSDSVIRQILCGQEPSKETGDNFSFVFDDELLLDRFYACYEEQKEFQTLNVCEPTTLFILMEKGSWSIKEVREYNPHN